MIVSATKQLAQLYHKPFDMLRNAQRLVARNKLLLVLSIVVPVLLVWSVVRTLTGAPVLPGVPHGGSTQPQVVGDNPLAGMRLYVDPQSSAVKQAATWRASRPQDAALMDRLAAQPTALWIGDYSAPEEVRSYVQAAAKDKSLPVLVLYNIVNRDCGEYSAGGSANADAYRAFVNRYAEAVSGSPALVILEPDALPQTKQENDEGKPCLSPTQQQEYYTLLQFAVGRLKQLPGVRVYLDAGNSAWLDSKDMAAQLKRGGADKADGFSLNVSNFRPTEETLAYGREIAAKLPGKHFVVDTSRNGLGPYKDSAHPDDNWCNPPGRGLGHFPTTNTAQSGADAYLYIKTPGESDGKDPDPNKCFGGPVAGEWWPEYALGLVKRWPAKLQP